MYLLPNEERKMISLLEKNGYTELDNSFTDLETGIKDQIGLISLKKDKQDIKKHRISGNRLDHRLIDELTAALHLWEKDDSIQSVILTSSHKVAFSRGAAIEEVLGADIASCRTFLEEAQRLLLTLQNFPKPLIAAINGLTLGGGFEIALACDARVAGTRENVIFGFPETTLGLIPAMGGTQNLKRLVGSDKACEIIGRGAVDITPEIALKLGITEAAVPSGSLISAAEDVARLTNGKKFNPGQPEDYKVGSTQYEQEIEDYIKGVDVAPYLKGPSAPLAAALTDFIFEKTSDLSYLEGLAFEFEVFSYLQQTEDCREGIQAMVEEREAVFVGR